MLNANFTALKIVVTSGQKWVGLAYRRPTEAKKGWAVASPAHQLPPPVTVPWYTRVVNTVFDNEFDNTNLKFVTAAQIPTCS
jgi:predicted membrane-bound mannosyltransferase